jgi:hypothetical protein
MRHFSKNITLIYNMKKHLLAIALFFCAVSLLRAQFTPQGFNYQSIVRTAGGSPLANQTVALLFTIRSGAPNGPVAYSEKQVVSTNEFGLVNLIIGRGAVLQGTFNTINWGGGAKFLSVSLETSPNVFDELGSSELLSVPYAIYAQTAANGGSGGGGGDNWGSQITQTTPVLTGAGTASSPLDIARQGANTGQVLKWDGTSWKPGDDVSNSGTNGGTVTQINTGTGLTGGPISTSGTISLSNSGVTPGVYGSATQIPVISIDPQGRITSVFTVVPQPGTVGIAGAAGINVQQTGLNFTITNTGDTDASNDLTTTTNFDGDVSGVHTNLQIKANAVGTNELANGAVVTDKIADNAINTNKIADNAVITAKIADNAITTAKIANNAVTTAKVNDNAITTAKIANGAVTATKLDDMGATNGQILKWNGTAWAPAADASGITTVGVTAGAGISVTGTSPNFTVINTGDTNSADDVTTTSTAGGDVSGTFGNLQIKTGVVGSNELATGSVGTTELANNAVTDTKVANGAITAAKLDDMGATTGQVLKWNGTAWAPDTDLNGGSGGGSVSVVGGTGITVTQSGTTVTVVNSGDTDAADDLTNTSTAGGDVSGTFGNLQLKAGVVTTTELADNSVAANHIINSIITGEKLNNMGAANGQVLKWNGSVWAPSNDETGTGGTGGDNWGTQAVVTGTTLTGAGTNNNPLNLAAQGAANGQVLKWDGAAWRPATDAIGAGDDWGSQAVTTTPVMLGNGTTSNPLTLAQQGAAVGQVLKWNGSTWTPDNDLGGAGVGDNWGTQQVVTGTTLSGAGTNASPLVLAQQAAVSGQVLKWNGAAWMPANDGGDNWGTQNVIVNTALIGNGTAANPLDLASQGASSGQVLKWNGSAWMPANDVGDNWGTQNVAVSTLFIGNGTASNPLNLSQQGASSGQVLKWNGTAWAPANDEVGTGGGGGTANSYSAGTGITITGTAPNFQINNIGDADNNPSNEIQTLSIAGSTLSLSNGGGSITIPGVNYTGGTGINISGNVITNAGDLSSTNELQSITLNGSQLVLSNGGGSVTLPTASSYNGGTGISITGTAPNFTVANTGDLSPTNELQLLSISGNNLTLSQGGGTVALPASITYTAGTNISITGTGNNRTINSTADPSSTNEIQTLTLTGNSLALSNGGGTVTLPTGTNYTAGTGIGIAGTTISNTGDLSTTNELQTMTLTGNTLSLSNGGGTVTLPGTTYTAGNGIGISGNVISNLGDVSATNEIQALTLSGNTLSLSNGGGSVMLPGGTNYTAGAGISISGGTIANTGDLSNSNELQTLSLSGSTLTLSGTSSTVDLAGLLGSTVQWATNGTHITNNNTGNVLIGTTTNNIGKLQAVSKGSETAVFYGEALPMDRAVLNATAEGKGIAGLFTAENGPAIATKGKVGINIRDPKFDLEVDGVAKISEETNDALLVLEQQASGNARMDFRTRNSRSWSVSGGISEFAVDYAGASAPSLSGIRLLVMDTARNVSFGVASNPLNSFKITHREKSRGLILENSNGANTSWEFWVNNGNGNLQLFNPSFGAAAAGTFATNGLYTPSDSRLKKDIRAAASSLNKIMQLQPVTYLYNNESSNATRSLGFLAQDVQRLFPELVQEQQNRDSKDSYLSLNYAGFGVLAIKSIQEQQAEIEQLKKENEDLRKRLERIEAKLDK